MAAMVNSLPELVGAGIDPDKDRASDSNPAITLFHRRIEFHAARKPFSGFSDGGNSGFKLVTLNPNSNSSSKSEAKKACFASGKASEVSLEHSSNGLDPELSFTITFRRIGAGLQNLGNTCFLNSVLQCLTYTEPLAAYLQSGRHKISCRMAGFCALCAIQKHVSRALESNGRILAPKDLVSNLRCISRNFRNARQEDAHEYMVNLLESMHKCCLPSGMPSESPTAYEKSLVHKIFGGRLRSQVKCMQCSFCSNKFDPFLDLSLEIVNADSVYKALAHFTAREQLDGGRRQYECQQCKQKVRALKQLTIYKPPEVLAMHLKRFGYVPSQKIDKKIHFGPTLDLSSFVTGPYDGDVKYTLYGVLVHAGWSTHSGHYYCFVRTSSGMWYSLDDNQVVQVSEKRVLEQKAYMLFYVRDRTFSLSRKTADTLPKENGATNTIGGKVHPNYSQGLKEKISNGTTENKLNNFSLFAEVAQKQALNAPMSKDIQMKGDSHLDRNSSTAKADSHRDVNGPLAKVDSHLNGNVPTAKVDSSKDGNCPTTSKEHPIENSTNVDCSMPTVPSSKGLGSVDLFNSTNERSSTDNGFTVPVNVQNDFVGLNASASKNDSASVVLPNDDSTRAVAVEGLSNAIDAPSNLNVRQTCPQDTFTPKETNAEKVGGSNNSGGVDSSVQKADSVGDGSCLSKTPKGLLCKKASDDKLHTVKRKPLKRFATKKLSKSIIFGAAFGRRKKRHRTEHHSSAEVDGNSSQADLGPSTSEKSKSYCASYSQKGVKCGSDEKAKILGKRRLPEHDDLQKGSKDATVRESIGQSGNSLQSTTQLNTSCSVIVSEKPSDTGKSGGSEHNKRNLVENGLMSMLTRGLEETTVARWDGVEYPYGSVESRSGESLSIGYIGDEWDEAYDAGKRKKVRTSKIEFDGSNPFQEIAMRKAKSKNGKLDRYSSANQPFRI